MKVRLLLWTPWESLRDSQGTTNHFENHGLTRFSCIFLLTEVDLFNRGRYEESFVKLSSQSPGKQWEWTRIFPVAPISTGQSFAQKAPSLHC